MTGWLGRRVFPLLATVGLIAAGMAGTIWGPRFYGKTAWAVPDDLWATMVAAQRLLHLDLGGLYTPPTNLISLPGTALILVPVAAVLPAAGLALHHAGSQGPHPGVWLLAGPCETALSATALFAADAIAERLGATRAQRFLLAAAGATALWSVCVRWGHPEDAVAVALLLVAVRWLADGRAGGAAWLGGAAVAVQPLALLAVPVLAAAVPPRRLAGFLARAAAPSVVLVAAAAAANWAATIKAVTSQPNAPKVDHPTPWVYLAPHLADGSVAAAPARALAIAVACGCGAVVRRRLRGADLGAGHVLQELLWWTAVALALRSVFEPVMVAYYLWPPLAVVLAAASASWERLVPVSATAIVLTFFSQVLWRNPWAWWTPMVTLLALTVFLARPRPPRPAAAPAMPEPGERLRAGPGAAGRRSG
ncbi:MAG: hypothetical protein JO132_13260 [Streptosporangiaceae bacterium]|nr:hypothetical protein [Streptosporangiaceae bacterium]